MVPIWKLENPYKGKPGAITHVSVFFRSRFRLHEASVAICASGEAREQTVEMVAKRGGVNLIEKGIVDGAFDAAERHEGLKVVVRP